MSLQTVRLDAVADLCLGKMLDKKKNKGNLRPYLANINVRWGTLDLEGLREMRFEDRELERYGLRSGDIVMCEGGEPGRCVLWREQVPGMMIQKALHRIRPHDGVDNEFLFYSLFHMGRSGQLEQHFTGATIKHLPGERLARVGVALPPLETQQRIAAILGAYDDLIEVNRRRVAVLEEMARGLFEEWFVRFRFPGHEDVPIVKTPDGSLPEGWAFSLLGDVADIQWGDTSITKKAYVEEGYRAYSASGPDGFRSTYDFSRVGVVLSAIGAKCGKTWLARGDWSCIKNTMRFWALDEFGSTEFLYLALIDPERWPKRGAAQPFISLGDARKLKVINPDRSTLERFGSLASPLLLLGDRLLQANERLAASRDLLLPRLISGQLSVEAAERQLEDAA